MAARGKKSAIYSEITDVATGNGAPALVEEIAKPEERAGYAPEKLDRAIQANMLASEAALGLIGKYGTTLTTMLESVQTHLQEVLLHVKIDNTTGEGEARLPEVYRQLVMTADDMARILERISKIAQYSAKGLDDLTRLRIFVVGGDDGDNSLADKGENELRRMILDAARGFQNPETI